MLLLTLLAVLMSMEGSLIDFAEKYSHEGVVQEGRAPICPGGGGSGLAAVLHPYIEHRPPLNILLRPHTSTSQQPHPPTIIIHLIPTLFQYRNNRPTTSVFILRSWCSFPLIVVFTMPLLPSSASAPVTKTVNGHALEPKQYRDIAYHLDHQDRYITQSYEVWAPSHSSTLSIPPCMQHPQLTKNSFSSHSSTRTNSISPRVVPEKSLVVIQWLEGLQQDTSKAGNGNATPSKPAVPPPAPQPRRLPTPELSDIDEERPFCECKFLQKVPGQL